MAPLLSDNPNLVDIRQQLVARATLDRLPSQRVIVDLPQHVDHRRGASVRQHAVIADKPTIPLEFPTPLGEAAVGVERPRPDGFGGRIPANDLDPAKVELIVDRDLKRAS